MHTATAQHLSLNRKSGKILDADVLSPLLLCCLLTGGSLYHEDGRPTYDSRLGGSTGDIYFPLHASDLRL
jgi:hypothetical protein